MEQEYYVKDTGSEKVRYNVIFAVNTSTFMLYAPLAVCLLCKAWWKLPASASILIACFLLSFFCKALADTFRAFLKGKINPTLNWLIGLSPELCDILQAFVIYYFVMNVGTLKTRFMAAS